MCLEANVYKVEYSNIDNAEMKPNDIYILDPQRPLVQYCFRERRYNKIRP